MSLSEDDLEALRLLMWVEINDALDHEFADMKFQSGTSHFGGCFDKPLPYRALYLC